MDSLFGTTDLKLTPEQQASICKVNFLRKMGLVWEAQDNVWQVKPNATVKKLTVDNTTSQIMTLDYVMTIGDQDEANSDQSPINIAARQFYETIRSSNTSLSAYVPTDVMKHQIAVCGLYIGYELLNRALAINTKFSKYNAGIGPRLNEYNTPMMTSDNIANIGNEINSMENLRVKLQALSLLEGIPMINRWMELAGNIYADDDIEQAGIILFRPSHLPYYDVNPESPTVGDIRFKAVQDMSFSTLKKWLNDTADSYMHDEDSTNISTEISKAGLKLYHLRAPSDKTEVLGNWKPIFSYDIIDGVKNARAFTFASHCEPAIIEDNSGALVFGWDYETKKAVGAYLVSPTVSADLPMSSLGRLDLHEFTGGVNLYGHEPEPSPKAMTAYTRWRYLGNVASYQGVETYTKLRGVQSEIITAIKVHMWTKTFGHDAYQIPVFESSNLFGRDADTMQVQMRSFGFVCRPETYLCLFDGSQTEVNRVIPVTGDIDCVANYSLDQAVLTSEAVIQACWNVADAAGKGLR